MNFSWLGKWGNANRVISVGVVMDLASMITPNPPEAPTPPLPQNPPKVEAQPIIPSGSEQVIAPTQSSEPSPPHHTFCHRCKTPIPYDQMASIIATKSEQKIILPLPGDIHFQIESCPACSPDHGMQVQLLPRDWTEILHVTLNNLQHLAPHKEFSFHFQEHIRPFIASQWERLCIGQVGHSPAIFLFSVYSL